MELRLDLHVHSAQSIDGQMSLGEIIDAARSRGLDGVAVCEHDRLFQPNEELEVPEDFLLIPGEEFTTEFGHVLGLFLTKEIRYRMPSFGKAMPFSRRTRIPSANCAAFPRAYSNVRSGSSRTNRQSSGR